MSKWVASKLKSITATIGVAFSGYESEVIHLLSRIEKNTAAPKQSVQMTPSAIRRQRELRRLEFGVNYDRVSASSVGCWFRMFRMLSWNVSGINDLCKRDVLKSFLRDWKCDLICLQEIKLEEVTCSVVRSLWGNYSVDFAFLKAEGASGGIIVMWDKNTFNFVSSSQGEFSITCIFQMVDGDFTWAFSRVYGPQDRFDKLRFWEELRRTRDGWPGPWCIGGDFNEILYPQERSSGLCPMNTMVEFHDFINYATLVDLPLRRGDYTRSRSGGEAVRSRLDRFLVSLDWEEYFPTHFILDCQGLSQIISQKL